MLWDHQPCNPAFAACEILLFASCPPAAVRQFLFFGVIRTPGIRPYDNAANPGPLLSSFSTHREVTSSDPLHSTALHFSLLHFSPLLHASYLALLSFALLLFTSLLYTVLSLLCLLLYLLNSYNSTVFLLKN